MAEKQEVLEQKPVKIEVIKIPKVYLTDQSISRRSSYHTAYCGTGAIESPGNPSQLFTLTFWRGIAYDVPQNVYDRFRDAGIATTDKPRRRWGDDD